MPHFKELTKLSVCMIVRNEGKVLQRCIDSLQNIHDELCIVDTGSTDDTIEISRNNGAVVERFADCNDSNGQMVHFALARNKALSLATGDWVLQIDADELLLSGHDRILSHLENDEHDQIGVLMSSDGANWVSVRVFKNRAGIHYRSRIHEYLDNSGSYIADRQILIENRPDKKHKENASDRNIRICELALKENPKEGRLYHYLGNEYRKLHRFSDAIDAYREALACGNFTIGQYHTTYYMAVSCLLAEDLDGATNAASQCLHIAPRYAEAPCLLGDICSLKGDVQHAKEWYQVALSKKFPPEDAVMATQDWTYSEYPLQRLQKLNDLCET
jgi:glycosyltransferase involved in cell wall biosynthesis